MAGAVFSGTTRSDSTNLLDAITLNFAVPPSSREQIKSLRRGLVSGEEPMKAAWIVGGVLVALVAFAIFYPCLAPAGQVPSASGLTVLEPIRHGALTIFPVVAGSSHDTREFITLDEGLRSG